MTSTEEVVKVESEGAGTLRNALVYSYYSQKQAGYYTGAWSSDLAGMRRTVEKMGTAFVRFDAMNTITRSKDPGRTKDLNMTMDEFAELEKVVEGMNYEKLARLLVEVTKPVAVLNNTSKELSFWKAEAAKARMLDDIAFVLRGVINADKVTSRRMISR